MMEAALGSFVKGPLHSCIVVWVAAAFFYRSECTHETRKSPKGNGRVQQSIGVKVKYYTAAFRR